MYIAISPALLPLDAMGIWLSKQILMYKLLVPSIITPYNYNYSYGLTKALDTVSVRVWLSVNSVPTSLFLSPLSPRTVPGTVRKQCPVRRQAVPTKPSCFTVTAAVPSANQKSSDRLVKHLHRHRATNRFWFIFAFVFLYV